MVSNYLIFLLGYFLIILSVIGHGVLAIKFTKTNISTEEIGFVGLGNVGGKLAGSLLRNNFDVTVRDIDESLTNEFKKLGAKVPSVL